MLQRLYIRNYAIIDEINIDFARGFNIITGETGAGKSILMGALGLVLGDRADTSVLHRRDEKCIVEATFLPLNLDLLHRLLAQNDLDPEDLLVVRREINAAGKSRSFVNDTPVTLQVLRVLGSQMADLHRQGDTLELDNDEFQRNVLDALAGQQDLLRDFSSMHNRYLRVKAELQQRKDQQAGAARELDYHQYLFTELEQAGFKENEIESLEAEAELLANAGVVKQVISGAIEMMSAGDDPLVQKLKSVIQQLQSLRTQPAGLDFLIDRLVSAQIELKDIAGELESTMDHLAMDDERLAWVNERLNLGNRLLKKHGLHSTTALLELQAELQNRLDQVLHLDDHIASLTRELEALLNDLRAQGVRITEGRRLAAAPMAKKVIELLFQVGMPNARLHIDIAPLAQPAAHGWDEIRFLFDANKSGRLEPLEKVASGGERSRLMLSIKSLVASSMQMPTLIFDEIDTGISGEAAKQVGQIMQSLSGSHQVIAITHQPQIAARASAHFFVYKQEKEGQIRTEIKLLSGEERVAAIARMLSGEKLSEASLQTAREMVDA